MNLQDLQHKVWQKGFLLIKPLALSARQIEDLAKLGLKSESVQIGSQTALKITSIEEWERRQNLEVSLEFSDDTYPLTSECINTLSKIAESLINRLISKGQINGVSGLQLQRSYHCPRGQHIFQSLYLNFTYLLSKDLNSAVWPFPAAVTLKLQAAFSDYIRAEVGVNLNNSFNTLIGLDFIGDPTDFKEARLKVQKVSTLLKESEELSTLVSNLHLCHIDSGIPFFFQVSLSAKSKVADCGQIIKVLQTIMQQSFVSDQFTLTIDY